MVRLVSTSTSRARVLRGAFVGACSALFTALAHAAGGGAAPTGSTLVELVLVCATVGAGVATTRPSGRLTGAGSVVVALGAGQALGHLTLAVADGHHCASALMPSAAMLVMHATAALVVGLLIYAVEYLYVIGCSVLSWLRRFATDVHSPATLRVGRTTNVFVRRPASVQTGLGMRAPPASFAPSA